MLGLSYSTPAPLADEMCHMYYVGYGDGGHTIFDDSLLNSICPYTGKHGIVRMSTSIPHIAGFVKELQAGLLRNAGNPTLWSGSGHREHHVLEGIGCGMKGTQ